ncbi:TonB family protein [Hymenobacter lucidus]|uniref:TonB family protein n=1 Tax=Hymenobacter lucidus TaxID=2880930 RepID=A0ABS8AMA2_9BACT|nr:TonB family protein [Hymenobacter lucidus]MCB2406411.1 TonB family protein [Hymenobacter lucidus]
MRPVNQPPVPPLPPAPDAAGHLALPLLRQYVAGTLPAAEQHRIEAHTLSCARCAEILEGLELTDPATTDAALRQLQLRLHQRVAQAEAPRRTLHLWQAAAAMLLLLLMSTAVWWGLRRPATHLESAPVAMQRPAAPAETAGAPAEAETEQAPVLAQKAAPAVAAAPAAASESAAVVAAAPARRPATARAAKRKPPVLIAANEPVAETMNQTQADAAADQAPAVALATPPAAAPVAKSEAAPAAAESKAKDESKATADTLHVLAVAPAKSKQARVAEEGAARKAALPPVPTISPQPVGGYIGLREYLRREGLFVPEPPARQLSGSVRVKFTVTAAGKLENFQILRSLRADYDSEAIRLLCEGPTWQPGAANGRRADQVVEISISF